MSDDPRRKSRRRGHIQVEPFESRALLSAVTASALPPSNVGVVINTSGSSVNQQQGSFTLTLSLQKMAGGGYAALNWPLTVTFRASLDEQSDSRLTEPDVASPIFAPFTGSVTFPAGVSTETVTVPIVSSVATSGPVTIWLFAAPPPTSEVVKNSALTGGNGFIQLYSSPDATPPTITSVRVVTHGKLASALVLGFSKPMAPATVENIHNYRILSPTRTIHHGSFLFGLFGGGALGSDTTETQSYPIAAATYDPSTATVTLALKRRVKASSLHEISSTRTQSADMSLPLWRVSPRGNLPCWFTRLTRSTRSSCIRSRPPLKQDSVACEKYIVSDRHRLTFPRRIPPLVRARKSLGSEQRQQWGTASSNHRLRGWIGHRATTRNRSCPKARNDPESGPSLPAALGKSQRKLQ